LADFRTVYTDVCVNPSEFARAERIDANRIQNEVEFITLYDVRFYGVTGGFGGMVGLTVCPNTVGIFVGPDIFKVYQDVVREASKTESAITDFLYEGNRHSIAENTEKAFIFKEGLHVFNIAFNVSGTFEVS
jgi:hypothetical protein